MCEVPTVKILLTTAICTLVVSLASADPLTCDLTGYKNTPGLTAVVADDVADVPGSHKLSRKVNAAVFCSSVKGGGGAVTVVEKWMVPLAWTGRSGRSNVKTLPIIELGAVPEVHCTPAGNVSVSETDVTGSSSL